MDDSHPVRTANTRSRLPGGIVHLAAASVVGLVLASAGQPLFSEDLWWHLSMGEVYLAEGPWLGADPLLHTAEGPPAPAAWLTSAALFGLERAAGFQGLRVAHVLIVFAILALAWGLLRRASGSAALASLGVSVFAILSAYRLFQLRPHLFTILATLLLLRLLVVGQEEPPSWRRVSAVVALLAVWANVHAGFVLGPVVIASTVAGLLVAPLLGPALGSTEPARDRRRAGRLAIALGLSLLATLANPGGADQYLPYFVAGESTPGLQVVADEWSRLDLLRAPPANLPPSPLAWGAVWLLLVATPAVLLLALRRSRAARSAESARDPALLGVAAVCLVAVLSAVRFLWLGIGALLVLAQSARSLGVFADTRRPRRTWLAAAVAVLLIPAFVWLGDWPMIAKGVRASTYARPYAMKLDAHAVWFLRDSELQGNLFNDYIDGGFLGYWLAPRMRAFVNGSLNVPEGVMDARHAIQMRANAVDEETFSELLDRYEIDVFFGTGLPLVPLPNRPLGSTTTHLERTPAWIPIFRNLRSGLYLRDNPRNRDNLERVAAWYAAEGVPFDRATGFDAARVLRSAPDWAVAHGLVPSGFWKLREAASSLDPSQRGPAQMRLAALYAVLGLYGRAIELDRRHLRADSKSVPAARRLVWSLLHADRVSESLEAAEHLRRIAALEDGLSNHLVAEAGRRDRLPDRDAAALVAQLPLLGRNEIPWLMAGVYPGEPRPAPDRTRGTGDKADSG